MFCRICGKHNEDGSRFCTGCGAPLQPITPEPGRNPEKEKRKEKRKGALRRVNWTGIVGLVLAIAALAAGIITEFSGTLYLYIAVPALLVCILALSFKRKDLTFTGFAYAGMLLSSLMMSVWAFVVVTILCIIIWGCDSPSHSTGNM